MFRPAVKHSDEVNMPLHYTETAACAKRTCNTFKKLNGSIFLVLLFIIYCWYKKNRLTEGALKHVGTASLWSRARVLAWC